MRISKNTPVYSRVAYDIASQIANGKLAEGQRFSGRSLMASQYAASSETIRRAMNLLSNMHIIEIQQNVGATVLSRQHAIAYVEPVSYTHLAPSVFPAPTIVCSSSIRCV